MDTNYIVLILLSGLICYYLYPEDIVKQEWKTYKREYGLNFVGSEEDYHRTIFEDRRQFIETFNRGWHSFTIGTNEFTHLTSEELSQQQNQRLITNQQRTQIIDHPEHLVLGSSSPSFLDWRTKSAVTRVRAQGKCGCCYAFGAVGAIEGARAIAHKGLTELSEQYLVDCSISAGNAGCSGGADSYTYQFIVKNGIPPGAKYTYLDSKYTPEKKPHTCRNHTVFRDIVGYRVWNGDGSEQQLLQAVIKGPTTVSVNSSPLTFRLYKGGVYYDRSCSPKIDHEVLVVGYGTDPKYGDYWIIKNSWGITWGEKGYMRLARNQKDGNCGIGYHMGYPIVSR